MRKQEKERELKKRLYRKRCVSLFEIVLMILTSFALAFLMSDNRVNAASDNAGQIMKTNMDQGKMWFEWNGAKWLITEDSGQSWAPAESVTGFWQWFGHGSNIQDLAQKMSVSNYNDGITQLKTYNNDPQNPIKLQSESLSVIGGTGATTLTPGTSNYVYGKIGSDNSFVPGNPGTSNVVIQGQSVFSYNEDGSIGNKIGTLGSNGKVAITSTSGCVVTGQCGYVLVEGSDGKYTAQSEETVASVNTKVYANQNDAALEAKNLNDANANGGQSTQLTITSLPVPARTGSSGQKWIATIDNVKKMGWTTSADGKYAITPEGNKYPINNGVVDMTKYSGNTYQGAAAIGNALGNSAKPGLDQEIYNGVTSANGNVDKINTLANDLNTNGRLDGSKFDKAFANSDGTLTLLNTQTGNYEKIGKDGTPTSVAAPAVNIAGMKFTGPIIAPLLQGLEFSFFISGVLIQGLGRMFNLDTNLLNSLSMSSFAGIMAFNGIKAITSKGLIGGPTGFWAKNSGFIGIGIGIGVFLLTYKSTKTETVVFTCMPYEPPLGGTKCEECNKDPFRPCSEYRCRSLGQACQLLNKEDPAKALCAWVGRNDVKSPEIIPWQNVLTYGLTYSPLGAVRPTARGIKIVNSTNSNKCIQAFTPLQFGINTDKPAQCKIDFEHKDGFDNMTYYFGESNYYEYNHTQQMKLPGPGTNSSGPIIQNDGTTWLYVRCRDANGNVNTDEYAINFCVDQGPDTTPPMIDGTSITSGSAVQYNADSVPIDVYVNEPSECSWSRIDKAYEDMENNLTCSQDSSEINARLEYTCSGNLTGIKNMEQNKFYFRCKDNPGKEEMNRNVNAQSYELDLKGSQPLTILNSAPNETVYGSTNTVNVSLEVTTNAGADEGKALCYFSDKGTQDSYVAMFETNDYISKQSLDLGQGNYTYYFRCVDSGGNAAETNTTFNVMVDKQAPRITRAYNEGQDSLEIVTDEDAQCAYSLTTCNFNINEGIKEVVYPSANIMNVMMIRWKEGNTYYIKCMDKYGNEPDPNKCSLVVGAIRLTNS